MVNLVTQITMHSHKIFSCVPLNIHYIANFIKWLSFILRAFYFMPSIDYQLDKLLRIIPKSLISEPPTVEVLIIRNEPKARSRIYLPAETVT